jgi:hypothetical protein
VAVERLQRCLKSRWKLKRIEFLAFAAPFRWHVLANVLPEVPEHRHLVAGNVFRYGHARELDDAALNGIHQREVAHRPGEQSAFGVPRTAEKKWGRGQVIDSPDTDLALERFDAVDPKPRSFIILFGLVFVLAVCTENLNPDVVVMKSAKYGGSLLTGHRIMLLCDRLTANQLSMVSNW